MKTSRREFMRLGTLSAAALAIGSGIASLTGCSQQVATAQGYKVLRESDISFLGALAPAILTTKGYPGALGAEAQDRLLKALDETLLTLQYHARSQLMMAFDLMSSAPLRVVVGAPWHSWQEASIEEANDFLNSWKTSLIPIKRMGYSGLCKLVTNCWYRQPENYPLTGYPGPPVKVPYPYPAATK